MSRRDDLRLTLLTADIRRAQQRRHHACPTHGATRVVCPVCARVWCPVCADPCPRCATPWRRLRAPTPRRPLTRRRRRLARPRTARPTLVVCPDAATQQLWTQVQTLGAMGIEPHAETGGWTVLFPYPMLGIDAADQLAQRLLAALGASYTSTPYGAGRWTQPPAWYVTVRANSPSEPGGEPPEFPHGSS